MRMETHDQERYYRARKPTDGKPLEAQRYDELLWTATHYRTELEKARDSLGRLLTGTQGLMAGKPVICLDETIIEAKQAISRITTVLEGRDGDKSHHAAC